MARTNRVTSRSQRITRGLPCAAPAIPARPPLLLAPRQVTNAQASRGRRILARVDPDRLSLLASVEFLVRDPDSDLALDKSRVSMHVDHIRAHGL
jgi:hypothetical protein